MFKIFHMSKANFDFVITQLPCPFSSFFSSSPHWNPRLLDSQRQMFYCKISLYNDKYNIGND